MILFHKLRYKNFLSTGDAFTEIDFKSSTSTLVTGTNGAGKSTMLDALSFCLFNKAHRRIAKPQLVNSVNQKNCVTEVEFTVGSNDYMIRRGIAPATFEIYINGSMVDQSSTARDYQLFLEQNILKFNYKTFRQVVILGSAGFTPFMELSALARREVSETLLDMNMFSSMNGILKGEISTIKSELSGLVFDDKKIESERKLTADHIKKMESMSDTILREKSDKITELSHEGIALLESVRIANAEIEKKQEEFTALTKDIRGSMVNLRDDLSSLRTQKKIAVKEISLLENNSNCPTCKQDIDDDFRGTRVNVLHETVETADANIDVADAEIAKLQKIEDDLEAMRVEIQEASRNVSADNARLQSISGQVKELQAQIQQLESSGDDLEESRRRLAELTTKQRTNKISMDKLSEDIKYSLVVAEMLKDSGIKTKIIKQYLPVINKCMNDYLQILDFFVLFEMDENFNETILSRHRDGFSYASFSQGEKTKIDLAMLFTWRQVARMKNSVSTNLLILDEVFDSSLDDDGTENLMKVLNSLDVDSNTFVISHKGHLLAEKFENGLKFEKVNNFSVMKKEA